MEKWRIEFWAVTGCFIILFLIGIKFGRASEMMLLLIAIMLLKQEIRTMYNLNEEAQGK